MTPRAMTERTVVTVQATGQRGWPTVERPGAEGSPSRTWAGRMLSDATRSGRQGTADGGIDH